MYQVVTSETSVTSMKIVSTVVLKYNITTLKASMIKKDLEEMSKIELLEYAKRARYVLGKNFHEMESLRREIAELKREVERLSKSNK